MEISKEKFLTLTKAGHNLDVIFLLELAEKGVNLKVWCESHIKIKHAYQGMLRKLLLNDDGTLSLEGKLLLDFCNSPDKEIISDSVDTSDKFTEWWDCYPTTDGFTHKNKTFRSTRTLRVSKPKCKGYFEKIVNAGKYTPDQIIAATKYDIEVRKENSVRDNRNHLTFLQNSGTYLYNDSYEGYIDMIKSPNNPNLSGSKALEIDI